MGRLAVLWPLLLPFCGDVARWKEEDEGKFGYRRRSRDVTGHGIFTWYWTCICVHSAHGFKNFNSCVQYLYFSKKPARD